MALPYPCTAVLHDTLYYKGHAHQLDQFSMTSTAIQIKGNALNLFNQSYKVHIMPLVINALGWAHTRIPMSWTKAI